MRTLTIEFSAYNGKRYSRPWGARIGDWSNASKPELVWGAFLGQHGEAGVVEIEASPGDVIRYGQRDNRGNGGINAWAIVGPDGKITECTPAEARQHWLAAQAAPQRDNPLAAVSDADLLAELARRGLHNPAQAQTGQEGKI